MNNVILLADKAEDNRFSSPELVLRAAADEIASGKTKATRALVILLDDNDEKYDVSFRMANIYSSQIIALADYAKLRAYDWLRGRE